ncbi:MAG: cytochrome c [Myxococcota bacterium]
MRMQATVVVLMVLGGCSRPVEGEPAEARGRQVYLANCTSCHHADPAQDGALGPRVKGASRALLERKLLHGDYPPGHTPVRDTRLMPPMPQMSAELDALAAFLR